MEFLNEITGTVSGWVWGIPLIVLLVGTGIWLTIRLRLIQIFRLPRALKFMVKNETDGVGEVSSFGALCTALSATIGTGNIVGVATAICAGGPGALFWMWVAAFFGMATKYTEGLLAIKYRKIDADGHVLGGPFYYIENGMGTKWKWLAKTFAFFGMAAGVLGIGTITQINGITSAVQSVFDPNKVHTVTILGADYSWATVIAAVVGAALVGLVVVGGIKRIAHVTQIIVPFMAILYVAVCFVILIMNASAVGDAFKLIVTSAFTGQAAVGGFAGAVIKEAIQAGVSRGLFSNESGLGSAPIAAAAAATKSPARQGLVSMTGTFLDTIIVCTMTGLAIVCTGAWTQPGLEGVQVTTYAFQQGLGFAPQFASVVLMVCLIFFAFTTILGWNYYGERCMEYLVGGKKGPVMTYRYLYIFAVLIGPFLSVAFVWNFADIFNGLMAIPNLIALLALSGVAVAETKKFEEEQRLLKLK